MLLTTGVWGENTPTFLLISLSNESPFIEAIFEPTKKVLILLTKEKEETYQMLPRLDEAGEPIIRKDIKKEEQRNPFKQQRISMQTYHECIIRDKGDIEKFVQLMAVNSEDFSSERYQSIL